MGEKLKALSLHDGGCALVIIDVKYEKGFPPWADEQGVTEEEVHLGHQETAENAPQIGGPLGKLDHEHRGLAEGDIALMQKTGNQLRIAHDHAGDRGLGRIDDAERENDHSLFLEESDHFEQGPHLVVEEDGEMLHGSPGDFFLGGRGGLGHGRWLFVGVDQRELTGKIREGVGQLH